MRFLYLLLLPFLVFSVSLSIKPNSRYICYITHIADGDTIRCRLPYEVTHSVESVPVRLIGIDTPETGIRKKNTGKQAREIENIVERAYHKEVDISKRDVVKLGLKAKRFVENLLRDVYVAVIETDVEPFDRYGRILAYVWLPNGTMLNKEIICNGYALPLTVPPNVKYHKEFLKCFQRAVKSHLGLWGNY
jgi:micrococcal nuclease